MPGVRGRAGNLDHDVNVKRRLFNFAAAVSLALCVVVCALWVRSTSRFDQYEFAYRKRPYNVSSTEGRIGIIRLGRGFSVAKAEFSSMPTPDNGGMTWLRGLLKDQNTTRLAGIFYGSGASNLGTGSWWVGVHFGVIVLLLAVAPGHWIIARARRRLRSATGACANCGYDLRATPERCPECGAEPAKLSVTST